MARTELFTDVFETDTFNQWRLKTNSIKLNFQDIHNELDNLPNVVVTLVGDQTVNGVKSFIQKSNWTKEYTQNEVTSLLELKVTNSMANGSNVGHKGSGPAIDFYNPDTTGGTDKTHLVSRIASITERTGDIFPDASLVFFTGKNNESPIEKMRINSDGQVGIGTSSPVGLLNIRKDTDNCLVVIQTKEDSYAAILFGDDKKAESGQIQYHNTDNSMQFFTERGNGISSESLRITGSGKVGIGVDAPSSKLEVAGNIKSIVGSGSSIKSVALNASDGSIEITRGVTNDTAAFIDFKDSSTDDFDCRIHQTNDNGLSFMTGGNGASVRRLTIDSSGNVGIGVIAPTSKLHVDGKTNITGRLGVLDVENPDYALCVGARSDEPGHVALNADGGAISLRPTKNTTNGWLINAFDNPGGDLAITSRKRNTATNEYDDTNVLRFKSNNSVLITKKLGITGLGDTSEGTPTSAKLVVKSSADDTISGQFRGAIQVNQFDVANRAYGFLSTNKGSAMVGGNLRLTDPSDTNIGKQAKVYIVADDRYTLYHNSNIIGSGFKTAGQHTFTITGNDRIGIIGKNSGGSFGLAFVVTLVETGEILLTSNKRDTSAVVNLPGTFNPRWNVDFNLFNVDDNTPQDGTNGNLLRLLREVIPGGDSGDAENIWKAGFIEDRNIFFQARVEDITQAFVKGTNDRGSSGIQFIQGAASTGQIAFIRATDNNNNDYFVNESARFDENGRLGIGTTEPEQVLDIVGNIRSSGSGTDGGYLFLQNDGYPQLILSNADGETKRFGIWKSGTSIDRMTIGPQATDGAGTGSIFIYRNATIEIPKGGKVNTVLADNNALVNKAYVDNAITNLDTKLGGAVSDTFQATGAITIEKGISQITNSMFNAPSLSYRDKGIIPVEGAGHYSHGKNFAAFIAATNTTDSGGLFLDVADNNNDEHALSIYNTSTAINKEVFHIRSSTGDTYSAGDIYARGGIASETAVALGNENSYFILEKDNNTLKLGFRGDTTSQNALSISSLGKVSITKEPTAAKHAATKGYVDKTLNASVITTLPKFSTADQSVNVNSSYSANAEFSFTIGDLCNLTTAELARVYAVDVTIHNFGSNAHDHNTSYKYPDGTFREVQGSKGFNSDDDCGSSAQTLLPVTGSQVTFKSNVTGTDRARSQRKVVINGFWYYDVASTPGIGTTSFPGLDQFDIDILLLPNLGTKYIQVEANIRDYLTTGIQHDILRNIVLRPTTTNSPDWTEFNELLLPTTGNPEFGILATSPNFDPADTDLPTSTYDRIKEFIRRGGTLFIFSDYTADNLSGVSSATRYNPRIESLIQELGGIKGIAPGDSPILNSRNVHSEWMHLTATPNTTFRTGDEAATLGVVDRNFTFRGGATGGIINTKSNGVSLAGTNAQAYSVIHMWDNSLKTGSLSSDIQGSIVWFGDVNFSNISGVMQPLLTHIGSS